MLSVLRAVSYYQYNTFRLQFDTACKLQLTAEQRIQQLSGEKERLDYERQMAEHTARTRISAASSKGGSGSFAARPRPAGSDGGGSSMISCDEIVGYLPGGEPRSPAMGPISSDVTRRGAMMQAHALSTTATSESVSLTDVPLTEMQRKREDALWRTLTDSGLLQDHDTRQAARGVPSLGSWSDDAGDPYVNQGAPAERIYDSTNVESLNR